MKGWIVYNGALKTEKILNLVTKVYKVAKERGMDIELVKNNELIPYYDKEGMQKISSIKNLDKADYILFWDKDILLGKHLEKMGIRLFNKAHVIEECDDKAYTFLKLSNLGIKVPKTIIAPFVYFEQNLGKKYIKEAGLNKNISPHTLRHTAATLLFKYGDIDIRTLQVILGHESVSTTQIYTHVDNKQIKTAIDKNPISNLDIKK